MTGNVMRGFSARAMLYMLLVVAGLFWVSLSKPAIAQTGLSIGFAVDGSGLAASSALGEDIGRYLERQLSLPVRTLCVSDEGQLLNKLTNLHEIDVAWLSDDSLDGVPAGLLYPLTRIHDDSPGLLRGKIVVRQAMDASMRQLVLSAFLNMHKTSDGKALLSQLGISRFASPEGEAAVIVDMAEQQAQKPSQAQDETEAELASAPVEQVDMAEKLPSPTDVKASRGPSPIALPGNDQKRPIALVADYLAYNSEEDSYEAKGDVVLQQGDVELKTEELLWQAATQDAVAQGSVFLVDTGTEITGERLQYNMATGQGQLSDGRVFVREGNFHLAGEEIEKHGQTEYFAKHGSFTTCDGEIPDWKFTASEVDVTLGGYARASNVWFHIKDVPVLYTPYMMFPVKTERESGFLPFSLGFSKNKGLMASLAWYQVIDRSMDATLYLDYLADRGLGKGLEYRYALANQNNGQALYYHVTGSGEIETSADTQEVPDLSYVKWEHSGNAPGGWRVAADIEYTEKQLFFEEFGAFVGEDYNRDKTVSTLTLRRNWQKLNLVGYARYINDLETDNDTTLQRLPEVGLGMARYRLGSTPFYAELESYATNFEREEGEDGERLYLKPSLAGVFRPGSWLEIVPQVALYERLYAVDEKDHGKPVPEFSLAFATRLAKSSDVNNLGGIDRIQHSFEPRVAYTYVPEKAQDDLPLFDRYDRVSQRNDVSYALINRFIARSTAADGSRVYRDLLYLRLSQNYDIDDARNDRSGKNQPFSDVRAELDFWPTRKISLNVNSLIPVYGNSLLHSLNVGSSVRDDAGNAASINYTYNDIDYSGVATDYLAVTLETPVLKPVYARFDGRYDHLKDRFLERNLGLEYRSKCWSILLTYSNRYLEDQKDDQELLLTFVLAGLGAAPGFNTGF
ncbi:MAG: LPS assembly protein LptD [Desulfuromonadales bacterium]